MPGYRAGPGSGLFGSYATPPQRPMVDLGGSIDALTNGASSLIAQAYGIKRAKAEFALQQQRENREATAQQAELAFKQKEAEDRTTERAQDFDLRQTAERHRFLEAGGIPSKTDTQAVPAGNAPITPFQPSPIASAMGGLPPVRVTPSNAPASTGPGDLVNANPAPAAPAASVPVNTIEQRTTPESYDPTRGGAYQRTVDAATVRQVSETAREQGREQAAWEREQSRLDAQQKGREFAAKAAKDLAQWKQRNPSARSAVGRAMTPGQEHTMHVNIAAGFLQQHGGYSQDALDTFRNTPEGQQLAKAGIGEHDLLEASTKLKRDPTTGQILSLINSGGAADVASAAQTVSKADSASKAIRRPTPGTNLGPAQPGIARTSPSPGVVPPGSKVMSAGATAPVSKPPGTAPPAAPVDDFSDDEVAAAMKAGKTTPDDVRAYIATQRKKKKGGA